MNDPAVQTQNRPPQSRLQELHPVAVVDIGSNSVRLVAYEGLRRSPTPLFNEKVLCGLGRGVAADGALSDASVAQAIETLKRFRIILDQIGTEQIKVIATAAVRDASNGEAFCRQAAEIIGAPVDVLSGSEEAELAARGVITGLFDANGVCGDLGGGSLELGLIASNEFVSGTTVALGGLSLIAQSGGSLSKAGDIVERTLDTVPWLPDVHGGTFFPVGGTWRAVARLHMAATRYPLHILHGYRIAFDDAQAFARRIHKTKRLDDIKGIDEISQARREVLPYGALVLARLIARMRPRDLSFSAFGVREGLLHQMMSDVDRAQDPLLTFCRDLARLRSRSLANADELCVWTDTLFALAGHTETVDCRRLRHAACLVSDIGWRDHPDYRAESCLNAIAHSTMSGVDHLGRAFIALAVHFRHSREIRDPFAKTLQALLPAAELHRARQVGFAIRAAHMISTGVEGVMPRCGVRIDDGKLVLVLPADLSALNGARLRRRLGSLAEVFGLQPVVEISEANAAQAPASQKAGIARAG